MANDVPLGGGVFSASNYAYVNDYGQIEVRGSAFQEYANHFPPADARKLGTYLLELADDAERFPVSELANDLARYYTDQYGFEYNSADFSDLAAALVKKGYRK